MMRITRFWGLLLGSPDFGKLLFSVTVEGCRMRGSGHRISELGGAYALGDEGSCGKSCGKSPIVFLANLDPNIPKS